MHLVYQFFPLPKVIKNQSEHVMVRFRNFERKPVLTTNVPLIIIILSEWLFTYVNFLN